MGHELDLYVQAQMYTGFGLKSDFVTGSYTFLFQNYVD